MEQTSLLRQLKDTTLLCHTPAMVRVAGSLSTNNQLQDTAVNILIDEPALRMAQAHVLGQTDREVGGFLIGDPPHLLENGRYLVRIYDTFVAEHTVNRAGSVTFTAETWRALQDRLAEHYHDMACVLGWYHSHPNLGIFLSRQDESLHQGFFDQPWHVALVLDPCARRSGFFCWNRAKTCLQPFDFQWPCWATKAW